MQFSEWEGGQYCQNTVEEMLRLWVQLLPVFHVLLHDDHARSQEKEKER